MRQPPEATQAVCVMRQRKRVRNGANRAGTCVLRRERLLVVLAFLLHAAVLAGRMACVLQPTVCLRCHLSLHPTDPFYRPLSVWPTETARARHPFLDISFCGLLFLGTKNEAPRLASRSSDDAPPSCSGDAKNNTLRAPLPPANAKAVRKHASPKHCTTPAAALH